MQIRLEKGKPDFLIHGDNRHNTQFNDIGELIKYVGLECTFDESVFAGRVNTLINSLP